MVQGHNQASCHPRADMPTVRSKRMQLHTTAHRGHRNIAGLAEEIREGGTDHLGDDVVSRLALLQTITLSDHRMLRARQRIEASLVSFLSSTERIKRERQCMILRFARIGGCPRLGPQAIFFSQIRLENTQFADQRQSTDPLIPSLRARPPGGQSGGCTG